MMQQFYGKRSYKILLCALAFSFKHLSIGRGGMILTDSKDAYETHENEL